MCRCCFGLSTSNCSKFALLSRSFLWFEIPSYSTQVVEPTNRSGNRRTCAFQSPIKKSKSCDPSRCEVCGDADTVGAGDSCALNGNKLTNEISKQIERDFMKFPSDLRGRRVIF